MQAWELAGIDLERVAEHRLYREFLRVPDLSAGLYVLEADTADPQSPHTEDELYYVVAGRGSVTVGDETRPVTAGSLVFVAATVPHRFHDIDERLEILVVFGPAEGGRGSPTSRSGAQQARHLGRQRGRQLRTPARLVVPEEDVGIVAGGQKWLEAGGPGCQLGFVVVVTAQAQVQEPAGSANGRWRRVLGQLRRAERRADAFEGRQCLVHVPAWILEFHGQWKIPGPRIEQRPEAIIVAGDAVGDAEEDRSDAVAERPVRARQPRYACRRIDLQRPV